MRNCFILIYISFTVLISCSDETEASLVGEDFVELDSKIVQIDTLSLETSTIRLDSTVTSGSGRLLIGTLDDSEFGDLHSQSFFNLSTNDFTLDSDAVFDSIALILRYDRYYYGDTLQPQNYRVHEITDEFEPIDEDQTYFYNTSTLNFDEEVLGELSFRAYPYKKDSINITLKHNFGENLFNNIQNKTVENYDDLEKIFKGITVVSDNSNNAVLGFKYGNTSALSSSVIRLYYTIPDEYNIDNDYYMDFYILDIFNNITSDDENTPLSPITDEEYILSSDETENQLYIRSGISLNMRVEIPYVRNLSKLEGEGTGLAAILKMFPIHSSYKGEISAVDSLAVIVVDNKNRFIKQLIGVNGGPVYATLNYDNEELNNEYYYTADITSFIEETRTSNYLTEYALLFQFPNNNNTVDKILIYDSSIWKEKKMKIELTYLLY